MKKAIPIGSMYGIYTNFWLIFMVNVGKYTSPIDPLGFNLCHLEFLPQNPQDTTGLTNLTMGLFHHVSKSSAPPIISSPVIEFGHDRRLCWHA